MLLMQFSIQQHFNKQILSISIIYQMQMSDTPQSVINNPKYLQPSQIVNHNIKKISKKFSTSEWFYFVQNTNQYLSKKRNRPKALLKDIVCNRDEELLEKYYEHACQRQEMKNLLEYYKYYTQSTINFHKGFFKLMHFHREKKKILEYNKLKVILNFSKQTVQSSTDREMKDYQAEARPFFNLLTSVTFSFDNSESVLVQKLKIKLEQGLGPNCHRTIEDLDKNYRFDMKMIEKSAQTLKRQKKIYEKESISSIPSIKKPKNKKQRNKSCQSLVGNSKRNQQKPKKIQGHHKSTTNLYSPKKTGSHIRQSLPHSFKSPANKSKLTKCTQTKQSRFENDLQTQIRFKIMDIKEQIRKEKNMLKKKLIGSLTSKPKKGHKVTKA